MADKMSRENYAVIQSFLEATEEFCEQIIDAADANVKNKEFSDFPSGMRRDYQATIKKFKKAYDSFIDALDAVDPEAPSSKKVRVVTALQEKVEDLGEVLEAKNAVFAAYLEVKLASTCTAVLELLLAVVAASESQIDNAIARVEKAKKSLEKAKKLSREAETQRAINVGITIATTVLLPELRLAKAAVAALVVAGARIKMDEILGPKGPTAAGKAKTKAFEYAGLEKSFGKTVNNSATVISGIDTLISDGVEVDTAEKLLKTAKKELQAAQKEMIRLQTYGRGNGTALLRLATDLEKARNGGEQKIAAYKAAKLEADKLEKELEYPD